MIFNGEDKETQSLVHLKYINVTNALLCFVSISSICKYLTLFVMKLSHIVKPAILFDNDYLTLQ